MRIEKYWLANSFTPGSGPRRVIASSLSGACNRINAIAIVVETTSACPSATRRPSSSSAPKRCAAMPVVPIRRKFTPLYRNPKIVAPTATAPR